jgi:hypothetical protein
MNNKQYAPMHKWLTDFDRYNQELPIYIEKPFNDAEIRLLRDTIETNRKLMDNAEYGRLQGSQEQYYGETRFHPKKIVHMSRLLIEFICPPQIEMVMNKYALPIHKDPIRLTHYNYIDYNMAYGDEKNAPALPPHLDADENLVTFNYCLDQNIEDWTLWVDDKEYNLKKGDAIIFSAVNQVHWRPKRKWKEGEFCEIVSFDYCPVTNYRWQGLGNPIDPQERFDERQKYQAEVAEHPKMKAAWDIYNNMGREIGLDESQIAGFADVE